MIHHVSKGPSVVARARWLVPALVALLVLGGCGLADGLLGGERPGLGAWNDTDIPIEIVLGDESLGIVEPDTGMEVVSTWRMPDLPWEVEARTESGRVLVVMTVTAEELARNGRTGAGVDLNCGSFSMWAGSGPGAAPASSDRATGRCEP